MKTVKRRETFYLSGYDPRGARHYYNLYRDESLKERRKGNRFEVGKRRRYAENVVSWEVLFHETKTNYHFLEWDDIIRSRWEKTPLALFTDMAFVIRSYVLSGLVFRYAKVVPPLLISGFYPIFYLLLTIFFASVVAVWIYGYTQAYLTSVGAFAVALLSAYGIVVKLTQMGNRYAVFWLLRIYRFSERYAQGEDAQIDARLEAFASFIAERIAVSSLSETDEVLIVSHSVGTILTVPMMQKLRRRLEAIDALPQISVLTLGECIPIVSTLPSASFYRQSMQAVSENGGITWLDYTTPIDGACFPLLDFYDFSGVVYETEPKPAYLSPRFHTLFSSDRYAKIRKNKYMTHFIYLMSTEFDGPYNFFLMTAGEQPLAYYYPKPKGS